MASRQFFMSHSCHGILLLFDPNFAKIVKRGEDPGDESPASADPQLILRVRVFTCCSIKMSVGQERSFSGKVALITGILYTAT